MTVFTKAAAVSLAGLLAAEISSGPVLSENLRLVATPDKTTVAVGGQVMFKLALFNDTRQVLYFPKEPGFDVFGGFQCWITDLASGTPVVPRILEEELPIPGNFSNISRFDRIEPSGSQTFEMPCVSAYPFPVAGRFRIVFTYISPIPEKMKIQPDIVSSELGRADSNAVDITVR